MTKQEIITALICCAEGKTEWCKRCPLHRYDENCCSKLAREALTELKASEIKLQELAVENAQIKRNIEECEIGYSGALALERAKIAELSEEVERLQKLCDLRKQDHSDTCKLLFMAEEKVKELKCQVERMRDSLRSEDSLLTSIITAARLGVAFEMASRLKSSAESRGGIKFDLVSFETIDKIAKEMIGETK